MNRTVLSSLMFAAGAVAIAGAVALGACSSQQATQFATNATTTAQAIDTVDTAVIKLGADVVANQEQLAAALAKTYCPIVNAAVSLGAAVKADAAVDAKVKTALNKADSAGALASDLCTAAGFGPTKPASAAPAAAVTSS